MRKRKGILFVISGPSGSGKTTLLRRLAQARGLRGKLLKSVSLTTRPQRSGEREGRDYFFLSPEEFRRARKQQKTLEWTRYLGYDYATPKGFIDAALGQGRHVGLCLDLKGAARLKRLYPHNTAAIFILPPSLATLRSRICNRCQKTRQTEVAQRLALAKKELAASSKYDYCLVNSNLAQTVRQLKKIVLKEINNRRR